MRLAGLLVSNNVRTAFRAALRSRRTGLWQAFSRTTTRLASEEEYSAARKWLQKFDNATIPRNVGEVSYSRSSGPGGQNVNKVNSKAQLRVPLDRLLPLVPAVMHGAIRTSQYYADKTNTLLIQADDSRKQGTNKDECYRKLHDLLLDTGNRVIPGETSEEQKEKVKTLKKHENESRLKMKKLHSSKKASRSNRSGD